MKKKEREEAQKVLKEVNVVGVQRFITLLKALGRIIATPFVLAGIIILIIAIFLMVWPFLQAQPRDLKGYLTEIYHGEKFAIKEKEIDEKDNGFYILSPKSNKEIIFSAYKNGNEITEDYSAKRLKYHVENYPYQDILQDFTISEGTKEKYGVSFLEYQVCIDITSYAEIEEATKEVYDIIQYISNEDKRMYEYIAVRKNNFYSSLHCNQEETYEEYLYRTQYEYIDFFKNQNMTDIPEEEINRIWKPKELTVSINQQELNPDDYNQYVKAAYDLKRQEYVINLLSIIPKVQTIEILKRNWQSNVIEEIQYHDQKYKIYYEQERKGNKIPNQCTISQLKEIFNAEVKYDFPNEKLIIEIN